MAYPVSEVVCPESLPELLVRSDVDLSVNNDVEGGGQSWRCSRAGLPSFARGRSVGVWHCKLISSSSQEKHKYDVGSENDYGKTHCAPIPVASITPPVNTGGGNQVTPLYTLLFNQRFVTDLHL